MKFSCTQENLNRGLVLVSHVASRNVNLPILHNVLVEAKDDGVYLSSTNLEIAIRVHVRGKVEEQGALTVPAQVFSSYVGLVNAERVDVSQEGNSLLVHAENQNTKMNGEAAAEFPIIPEVDRSSSFAVPAHELEEGLRQTLIAVSRDESRPELTGVLFSVEGKTLTLASTDSYRLAERKIHLGKEAEQKRVVIIPAVSLSELSRILSGVEGGVLVYITENQALFVTPEVELTTRLIEGVFPDYVQIIPQTQRTESVLKRDKLVKAIKAASLFSKSGIHDINLHFSPEKQAVTLTTVNNQLGENVSKVEAEITGDSNHAIYNHRYVLDALNTLSAESVVLLLVDNVSPGVLRPHGEGREDYTYIIMPIKQ
jgi:DNA polymerase-3 subunit beta